MNTEYTPKPCTGNDAKFKGSVVLRVPTIDERLEYMADAEVPDASDLEAGNVDQKQAVRSQLKLMKLSYDHYVKVDIKRVKDKKHYQEVDDLRYDSECQSILQDVANKIVAGFSLGNSEGRKSGDKQ